MTDILNKLTAIESLGLWLVPFIIQSFVPRHSYIGVVSSFVVPTPRKYRSLSYQRRIMLAISPRCRFRGPTVRRAAHSAPFLIRFIGSLEKPFL